MADRTVDAVRGGSRSRRLVRPAWLALVALAYALGIAIAAARGAVPDARALVGAAALLPAAASADCAAAYADRWLRAIETGGTDSPRPVGEGESDGPRSAEGRPPALRAAASALLVAGAFTVGSTVGGALPATAATLLAAAVVLGWVRALAPVALGGGGLDEPVAAAVGGILLPAYGAATVGGVPGATALVCLPVALLAFANLLAVRGADPAGGRRSALADRLAPERLRALYLAGVGAAFLALAALWRAGLPAVVAAAGLPAVPLAAWAALRYLRRRDPRPGAAAAVGFAVCQLLAWAALAG